MKVQGVTIKLIVTAALMLQMGCTQRDPISNANRNRFANTAGTVQQSQGPAGNLFGRNQQGQQPQGSWGSMIGGASDAIARARATNALPGGGADTGIFERTDGTQRGDGRSHADQGGAGDEGSGVAKAYYEVVNTSDSMKWLTDCKALNIDTSRTATDTDGDGISDACEEALSNPAKSAEAYYRPGLKKDVYNGALVSTKLYVKKEKCNDGSASETSLCLTDAEKEAWKASKKNLGNKGEGADSLQDKRWIKKFAARAYIDDVDLGALKTLFNVEQSGEKGAALAAKDKHLKMNNKFLPHVRSTDFGTPTTPKLPTEDADYYALLNGGLSETIPFRIDQAFRGTYSDFTGVNSSSSSLRGDKELMYVAEFNFVIPEEGIEIQSGYLFSKEQKIMAGSKAGMFIVMNGESTEILSTDLLETKEGKFAPKTKGTLTAMPGCLTTHVVMVYYADSKDIESQGAKFSDNLFYRKIGETEWRPISQDLMTVKPLGDPEKCKVDEDKDLFFDKAKEIISDAVSS